ncbi:ribonuclease HII [Microbacteriaceae bacterium 4G12]
MEKRTISQIQLLLQEIETEQDERFIELLQDERKGVQKLLSQWMKQKEAKEKEREHFKRMSQYEADLRLQGMELIAGVDEVGRGPLAGPVVAAAVILPSDFYLAGLNDSKKLSEAKREQFYSVIQEQALAIGVGIVSVSDIDELNIYQATKRAMTAAIVDLQVAPEHLLIDAMELPLSIPQTSLIKGDARSISIAAASVIAKVTRDHMMKDLGEKHPQYGFEKHMGYGTKEHIAAIQTYGILPEHRKTFEPIKSYSK